MHYLFLAVFAWALCEGISIYMWFVALFYKGTFQRLRFFLLLGWGKLCYTQYITIDSSKIVYKSPLEPYTILIVIINSVAVGLPIPIAVVSAAVSYNNYGIKDDSGETIA